MSAERVLQHNLAGLLVVEALDRVAMSTVRQRVLKQALEHANLDDVPSRIADLTFFVSGPLYEQAAVALGADFADELLLEMSAALDRAWKSDRARLDADDDVPVPPTSDIRERAVKRSSIRRAQSADSPTEVSGLDTEPVPDTVPAGDSMPPQVPSSSARRFTMPYLPEVFSQAPPARRLMIIDADDDTRRSLAGHYTGLGYAVATAHSRELARALLARLEPTVVIADVETIAPDFEPLRPAIDELFDDKVPEIILLADGEARELPPQIAFVIQRPWSEDTLDAAVEALLPAPESTVN